MARPVNADPEKTKALILEKATELFSKRGQKATMRELSKHSGFGLATIMHHYKSKDNLYDSCLENMFLKISGFKDEILSSISSCSGLEDSVKAAVKKSLMLVRTHILSVRLLLRTVIDEGEIRKKEKDAYLVPLIDSGAEFAASIFDVNKSEARLLLLSINHLIVRYGVHSEEELKLTLGLENNDDVDEILADHIQKIIFHYLKGAGVAI